MNIAPTPKVGTALIAGSLTSILVWILGQYHVTIPAEVAAAITTVISFLASWFAPRSTP